MPGGKEGASERKPPPSAQPPLVCSQEPGPSLLSSPRQRPPTPARPEAELMAQGTHPPPSLVLMRLPPFAEKGTRLGSVRSPACTYRRPEPQGG